MSRAIDGGQAWNRRADVEPRESEVFWDPGELEVLRTRRAELRETMDGYAAARQAYDEFIGGQLTVPGAVEVTEVEQTGDGIVEGGQHSILPQDVIVTDGRI